MRRLPEVRIRQTTPGDVWKEKDEHVQRERESDVLWADLNDEERAGTLLLVKDSLLRLLERLDVWVPRSLTPRNGNRLELFICLDLAEIDAQYLKGRVSAERLRAYTTDSLMDTLRELEDETTG